MQEPANENLTFGPCPNCGLPLRLGLIEPDEPEHEKRTYQCDSVRVLRNQDGEIPLSRYSVIAARGHCQNFGGLHVAGIMLDLPLWVAPSTERLRAKHLQLEPLQGYRPVGALFFSGRRADARRMPRYFFRSSWSGMKLARSSINSPAIESAAWPVCLEPTSPQSVDLRIDVIKRWAP